MDRISEQTRSILPITWHALSDDTRIGDSVLTARIDFAKRSILGSLPGVPAQNAMNGLLVEYVAKYAAIQIIDTAIDFWMDVSITRTTTGTNEVTSYESRIKALEDKRGILIAEMAQLEPQVIPFLTTPPVRSHPLISSIDDDLLSPNPQDLGPIYGPRVATG